MVFALYPNKEIFGIVPKEEDKTIYTDILFSESSTVSESEKTKKRLLQNTQMNNF